MTGPARVSRCLVIASAVCLILTCGAGEARAAVEGTCENPSSPFTDPVQVVVLDYGFVPSETRPELNELLSATAQRLSRLLQLDALYHDSYGGLAAVRLHETSPGACDADLVAERLVESLPPGRAIALLWGRIFREDDDVFVQSYLRFFRLAANTGERIEERVELTLPDHVFTGKLPAQSMAFAPRRFQASDLERVERAYRDTLFLRDEPTPAEDDQEPDAGGRSLEFGSEGPFAYRVLEQRPDGWLRIELLTDGEEGWLLARPDTLADLRSLMPELDFLEGVVGYLSYLQARDGRLELDRDRDATVARLADRFAAYRENAGPDAAGTPMAMADVLPGVLLTFDGGIDPGGRAEEAKTMLERARTSMRADGRLRNLIAMADLAACCLETWQGEPLKDASSGMLNSLSLAPNEDDTLVNLEGFYNLVLGLHRRFGADAEAAPAVTLAALPVSEDEALSKLETIRRLRAATVTDEEGEIRMPALIHLDVDEAREVVRQFGLEADVGIDFSVTREAYGPNTVARQEPEAGAYVRPTDQEKVRLLLPPPTIYCVRPCPGEED